MRPEYKPARQCRGCERWYIEGERIDHWHRKYHGCRGEPIRPRARKRDNLKAVTTETTANDA